MRGTIFFKSTQLLAYADDVDIMGKTTRDVQAAIIQLERAVGDLGLHINEGKTRYMVVTSVPKSNQPTTSNRTGHTGRVKIGDYNFETVDNFFYLGSKIKTDGSYDDEIRAIGLKLLLYKTMILPVLGFLARIIANSWPRSREESSEEFLAA